MVGVEQSLVKFFSSILVDFLGLGLDFGYFSSSDYLLLKWISPKQPLGVNCISLGYGSLSEQLSDYSCI